MDVHAIKTVPITLKMVAESYQKVRAGGKAAGIDDQSWEEFDKDAQNQLYILWNRLTSGTYFASAVKQVEIPKKDGRKRKLGIPTLRDRIAQGVVKDYMEKRIDHHFHQHSYGYRPMKSAHQALSQVRKNCRIKDWLIDIDIEKFFDEIDHELLVKAIESLIEEKWVVMYVKRWLKAKIQLESGEQIERGEKGTPQGGVISPLLANLFLHFAIDKWLEKNYSAVEFVRYADDIVIHCETKEHAEEILQAVKARLQQLNLKVNESKTKIVYCSDYKRKLKHSKVQFDFLGFSFRPRRAQSKTEKRSYTIYSPDISIENQHKIIEAVNSMINWRDTTIEIEYIAKLLNARIRGWINYFGIFGSRRLRLAMSAINYRLICWLKNKHKLSGGRAATSMLRKINERQPYLFAHWHGRYCSL